MSVDSVSTSIHQKLSVDTHSFCPATALWIEGGPTTELSRAAGRLDRSRRASARDDVRDSPQVRDAPAASATARVGRPGEGLIAEGHGAGRSNRSMRHRPGPAGMAHRPGPAGIPHRPAPAGIPHRPAPAGMAHRPGPAGIPHRPAPAGIRHPPGLAGIRHPPGRAGMAHRPGRAGIPHRPAPAGIPHRPARATAHDRMAARFGRPTTELSRAAGRFDRLRRATA